MPFEISVVIQFLNAEKYLPEAVESVFRQTFTNWELVLVDGGSTDGTRLFAENLVKQHPDRVRYFRHQGEKTLGIYSSRILGAKEARAPVLGLLDSDDTWHPDFLRSQYAIHKKYFNARPGMVFCPVIYWFDGADHAARSYVQPSPPPGLHEPSTLMAEFCEKHYAKSAANTGVMISRELVTSADRFICEASEVVCDDQYLWTWVYLNHPVFVNPEPLARYRQWLGSNCADQAKTGVVDGHRQKHLEWMKNYISREYSRADQEKLLKEIDGFQKEKSQRRAKLFLKRILHAIGKRLMAF